MDAFTGTFINLSNARPRLKNNSADGKIAFANSHPGSKTAVTCGCVRAFQQVSSTPMNGLEMTLAPFKIWLCCIERQPTPPGSRMWG